MSVTEMRWLDWTSGVTRKDGRRKVFNAETGTLMILKA